MFSVCFQVQTSFYSAFGIWSGSDPRIPVICKLCHFLYIIPKQRRLSASYAVHGSVPSFFSNKIKGAACVCAEKIFPSLHSGCKFCRLPCQHFSEAGGDHGSFFFINSINTEYSGPDTLYSQFLAKHPCQISGCQLCRSVRSCGICRAFW